MDIKKLAFADQFSSFKKMVVSGFGLGLLASFIVLSVVLFNFSFPAPFLNPVFQGFSKLGSHNGSSIKNSWPFPFSSGGNIVSNVSLSSRDNESTKGGDLGDSWGANQSLEFNFSGSGGVLNFTKFDDKGKILNVTHEGGFGGAVKSGSVSVKGRFSVVVKNGSDVGGEGVVNNENGVGGQNGNLGFDGKSLNGTYNGGGVEIGVRNESSKVGSGGIGSPVSNSFYEGCDIFDGRWVRDDSKPFYPPGSCPYIDRDFDCHLNGRKDRGYLKWKWQPYGCDMPSLNATDFLERLRGRKLVFVGDSLNRNMWESLVCILRQSIRDKKRVYEISGKSQFKKKGFYAFRFEDYDCTVDFVGSPFLVKELLHNGKNGSYETLRLDMMDQTTSMYRDADVIIFNTGHWWTHEKTSKGEDYYQEGNYVYPRLKVLEAYKRALNTWAKWVDNNIDPARTHVIFRGYSVTHFRGGPWNSGGQCHNESEPFLNDEYLTRYPSKMKAFDNVHTYMKTPVIYLNISRLTDYRKDAHPSIYRKEYRPNLVIPGDHVEDCSHWCLPGVPDTWNDLLYASLLQSRKGSWGV